jgi:DDE family transposase
MVKKTQQETYQENDMPDKNHHTTRAKQVQADQPSDDWATEVVARLPERVEQQARALKAFQRSRQIRSATDLLRGLLAYVSTTHSFAHLSMWSVLIGLADVSATDWRKRLQRASMWGNWLLQELLATSSAVAPWLLRGGVRRVLLIDGTHLKCRGPLGQLWRVHTAFDLLAGRLTPLHVTDTHEAEHLEMFELQEGDVVVTDRANGYRERLAFVQQRQAEIVVRFSPSTLPLEDEQGKAVEVVRWLKGCHAPAGRLCRRLVWIRQAGQRIGLRLVAVRLSAQQRQQAQRRKKRQASKQQRRMQADTFYVAGWVLLVTTLPKEQWSDQQVAALYQARWHIELLFKRIKQLLHQQRLRCTTAATALPTLIFLLVGWALLEEESHAVRLAVRDAMHCTAQGQEAILCEQEERAPFCWQNDPSGSLSEWMLAEICVDLLCQQIRGTYTAARFRDCLPRLQRFLCPSHRKRPHLYTLVCRWLALSG